MVFLFSCYKVFLFFLHISPFFPPFFLDFGMCLCNVCFSKGVLERESENEGEVGHMGED